MKYALLLFVIFPLASQEPKSPREALNPRTYAALTMPPVDQILYRLEDLDRKLQTIYQQHQNVMEQQRILMTQIAGVLDLRVQVTSQGESLHNVADRISDLDGRFIRQEGSPRTVAVLETKMDAMGKLMIWLMGGIASLIMGGIAMLTKQPIEAILLGKKKKP